jgi:SAM-dependent methyltransferase
VSNLDPAKSSPTAASRGKIYTCGYSSASTQIMASRTAEVHAKFLLPYLRAGMRLLDCGCGPGSITVGLAKAVAPGEAVGIDIEPAQLDMARAHAAEQAVTNVHFGVDDICDLSFPDSAFDAVFGHTILMQFEDPIRALAEVRRVLKPGGIVGFREPIFSSNLAEPPASAQDQLWKLFGRVLAHNGGDIDIGRRLAPLLQSMGFAGLTMSASFSGGGTPEAKRAICERWVQLCEEADFMKQAIALGWIGSDVRATMMAELRAEGTDPVSFFATAWREIVGWKAA